MQPRWVWFDFENTPHVLFLQPIIRRLQLDGWDVRVTARSQAQTLSLAEKRGISVHPIGGGDFDTLTGKMIGVLARAASLSAWIIKQRKPSLLISCSRSASLAALFLRIPGVGLLDYEHAEQRLLAAASRVLWLPDLLRDVTLPLASQRVARFYEGLKENLYLDDWQLDRDSERGGLNVMPQEYLVVARPPAVTAHYASQDSLDLWLAAVSGLQRSRSARVVVIARTAKQRQHLGGLLSDFKEVEFIPDVVSGPSLVAAADLVVGGGGTMNREAAVLGVPVWSVFTGPAARIDEQLATEGRLRWVRTHAQLAEALAAPPPVRMPRRGPFPNGLGEIFADVQTRLEVSTEPLR